MSQDIRKLLVLDGMYSLEAIRKKGLEDSITSRDLGGFFSKVWTVHPFASLVTSRDWAKEFGRPEFHDFAPGHQFIEGKIGLFAALRSLPVINFLLAQLDILLKLRSLICKEKINIILASEPHLSGLLGWILSRFCGIPMLVRVGTNYDRKYETTGQIGMPRLFRTRRIEKLVERFILKNADYVACPNVDNLEFVIKNGARPETSTLFRYGNLIAKQHLVDPNDRPDGKALLKELGVEPRRFLVYIGRLEENKFPGEIVRILAAVRRRGYDLKAVLIGDGRFRSKLVELARDLEVENYVVFAGNRDQQWLSSIIPLVGVVVSPITGRSLTEAAFGAAPIVAYDLDWQKELIESGVTGEMVEPFECEEAAEAVIRILNDSKYARTIGNAVRKRALDLMHPEKLNQHERDIYLKLLNGSESALK